jgi:hypothetical protein
VTYTGTTAKNRALAKIGKSAEANHCLMEVREIFGIGQKYGSAIAAWNGAQHKHTSRPPSGAVVPVFFDTSSRYEHVAIALGDGRVATINGSKWSLYSSIDAMCRAWGVKYLGYSEDLNGVRVYTPPPPKPKYTSCTALQKAVRATTDNVWGDDSSKRLNAVRAASNWKGKKFPYGVRYTQGVVGTKVDGVWGGNSNAAHDATVRAIQRAVGVKATGVYNATTDNAVKKYLSTAHKV